MVAILFAPAWRKKCKLFNAKPLHSYRPITNIYNQITKQIALSFAIFINIECSRYLEIIANAVKQEIM